MLRNTGRGSSRHCEMADESAEMWKKKKATWRLSGRRG